MHRLQLHRPAGLPHLSLKAWDMMVTQAIYHQNQPRKRSVDAHAKNSLCTYLQGLCLRSSSQNQSYDTEQQTYPALPTQMPFISWWLWQHILLERSHLQEAQNQEFVGMLHSHLRQKLQTTGCNWSCGVEGPEKLFLQELPRDPQGPLTPCLPNRNTLPCAGERMLTAF